MKTIFRVIFALMTLLVLSVAHAATVPISTIKNEATGQCLTIAKPLTMTDCDLRPQQNFNFGPTGPIFNSSAPAWLNTPDSQCLNGSYAADGSVDAFITMASCTTLTSYWWRPGGTSKHIYMSSDQAGNCLTQVGSTVESRPCSMDDPNKNWVIDSAVPLDWPFNGLVTMQNQGSRFALQAPGAFTSSSYKPGSPMGMDFGLPFMNSHLQFTQFGTIKVKGYCLTADAVGRHVLYAACDGSESQKWHRHGNQMLSSQDMCIGVAGNSIEPGALAELQPCATTLFQAWDMEGLADAWPPAADVPSTIVPGATLTDRQVNAVVDWIQAETSISTTPFCYKTASYDRGIGIEPSCGAGKQMDAGLCYDACRSGYKGVGPVCWSTQSPTYNPGQECTYKIAGKCVTTKMKSCRAGYSSDHIATCWLDKTSYGRDAGTLPTECGSNRQMQAGLCYASARAGYDCVLTNCTQNCPAGTSECGIAACASSTQNCASSIVDMVVSPLEVIAFIGTGGAAGAATTAVKAAIAAKKAATLATEIYAAEEALRLATEGFMTVAEANLGHMSTDAVEAAVANGYGRGSANYKFIAREWAARLLLLTILELEKDIATIMITTMEPSGIASTAIAFAKPPCTQHTTMPKY